MEMSAPGPFQTAQNGTTKASGSHPKRLEREIKACYDENRSRLFSCCMDRPLKPQKETDISALFAGLTGPQSTDRDWWITRADSQAVIAREVARGLELRNMNPFTLFELSGVPIDTIMSILDGSFNLNDSEPITAIEGVLRVPLRHL
jgi:hypothetical protein